MSTIFRARSGHDARRGKRKRRFVSFSGVGAAGFCIDASILTALVAGLHWGHYAARAVSFGAAVTFTWYCNRRWVFQKTDDVRREYGAYVAVALIGAVINLGAYVSTIEAVPALGRVPVVPLAIGAGLALAFNYAASSRLVFGHAAARIRQGRTQAE